MKWWTKTAPAYVAVGWAVTLGAFAVMAQPLDEELLKLRTIAVRPALVYPEAAPEVREAAESSIVEELRGRGYEVVEPTEFRKIWDPISARVGGVVDVVTGEADEKKYEQVSKYARRELARKLAVDAVLNVFVFEGQRPFHIEGVYLLEVKSGEERIHWEGKPVTPESENLPQRIVGTYLAVTLFDLEDLRMYERQVPLELVGVYLARGREVMPHEERFSAPFVWQSGARDVLKGLPGVGKEKLGREKEKLGPEDLRE